MTISSRGWFLIGASVVATAFWSGSARADDAGNRVLGLMDSAMNRAKTQYFEYEAVSQEPGKAEKKLGLKVYIKGEKRLTEFTAPSDMKGTKVLILSITQMYVFLPAFGKVRRIASHMTDAGFMGLAFSQDDFATQRYSPVYDAKLVSETASQWKLSLTAKPGQEANVAYAKIEALVNKEAKHEVPTELKYFNADGKNVKTETRTGYSCESDVCTSAELKMVDHTKGDLWTKMIRKVWKVNSELSDDLFSKRSLEK